MPSRYAGVDVRQLFPKFRPGHTLRFSRLSEKLKANSRPNISKVVKKRRRKGRRRMVESSKEVTVTDIPLVEGKKGTNSSWRFEDGAPAQSDTGDLMEEVMQAYKDLDVVLLQNEPKSAKGEEDASERSDVAPKPKNMWRHGPAELWYDMLGIPEDAETLDYGFKLKPKAPSDHESSSDEGSSTGNKQAQNKPDDIPEEAFLMVTQYEWEKDVIWDASDIKDNQVIRHKTAGWFPTGGNRTAQDFSQPGASVSSVSTSSSVPAMEDNLVPSFERKSTEELEAILIGITTSLEADGRGGGNPTWDGNPISYVENPELCYGRWEDDVIWDAEEMDKLPEPKILTFDLSDENIVFRMPEDVDPNAAAAQRPVSPVKGKKNSRHQPYLDNSKMILGKAGVIKVKDQQDILPKPSAKYVHKDPYNISNDEYYEPKLIEQPLMTKTSGLILQHSTPVMELRGPFIPTHLGPEKLRNFHRPAIRKYSVGTMSQPGPHPILPLTNHIEKTAKTREQERLVNGLSDIFFMHTSEDLTGKDGELLLIEYCEEHPPLLSQVGMCSTIRNYYMQKSTNDNGHPKLTYGETSLAPTSPFLGTLRPGETLSTLENNMYRSPIFLHRTPATDFLLIRDRDHYYIREIDGLYTAGQECPLYEVPIPNSKKAIKFFHDFLKVFVYRLFWKSKDNPRRIRMEEIKEAFPMYSKSSIRKRLNLCADFKRTGLDSSWWVIKPDVWLPTEEEIQGMVSPEQCCAYFSLMAAEQRLKDAGYKENCLFTPEDENEDKNQEKIEDEIKTAPWNTTRAYIQAMKGKCLLQLTGPADPTGCGEGFSYVRVPNKPQTTKEELQTRPKKQSITGTDADLRLLPLDQAKALLTKSGVSGEALEKLSRWEVVDLVRTLSTEKEKAGEEGMPKFSRGSRFSVAEHQQRYKEECQRIFELQNKVLGSSEVLSTDEGGTEDEEELSDVEEMGKNIENMLSNKKTSTQFNHEQEEQERLELKRMILGQGTKDEEEKANDAKEMKKGDNDNNTLNGLANHPGRVLKISRIFKTLDGKDYTRTEIVKKSAIIDVYTKLRTSKDDAFIRKFALLDNPAHEEKKKERKRIQDRLRRMQRKATNQKEKPRTSKRKTTRNLDVKMKCGACGQIGHMRTNRSCPLYYQAPFPAPPVNIIITQDKEKEIWKQHCTKNEPFVKLDGTKLKIFGMSGKLIKPEEEVKRGSSVLKDAGDGCIKTKQTSQNEPSSDYLIKRNKTINRQRIDPTVSINVHFENILNDIREIPNARYFYNPVNPRQLPNYHLIVKSPMDLQRIREKIRSKKYNLRSDFLQDIQLIRDNSCLFNGKASFFTLVADQLVEKAKQRLNERSDELETLEKKINPLLDGDQRGFNFILENCIEKLKAMPEAYPFMKPVDRKALPHYYDIIEQPMDFEVILRKIKSDTYCNREEFVADLQLIYANASQFNGAQSVYAKQGLKVINASKKFLSSYADHLSSLEIAIGESKEQNGSRSTSGYDSVASSVGNNGKKKMGMVTHEFDATLQMDNEIKDGRSSLLELSDDELEEGEYRSDEEAIPREGLDDNSQKAGDAMLMRGNYSTPGPSSSKGPVAPAPTFQLPELPPITSERRFSFGSETPEKINDDLAASEADKPLPAPNPHAYAHQPSESNDGDDDGGIWF